MYALIMLLLGVPLVCTAVALGLLTTSMHEAAGRAAQAVASVHRAQEIKSLVLDDLAAREPGRSAVRVRELVADLEVGATVDVHPYVSDIERAAATYFEAARRSRAPGPQPSLRAESDPAAERAALFAAIDHLLAFEVASGRSARVAAAATDRMADVLAVVSVTIAAASAAIIAVVLLRLLMRPLRELHTAVDRFRWGDRGVRAPVGGVEQIADLGRAFDEVIVALVRAERERVAFVGSVAHDIRDPLTVMRFTLSALEPALSQSVERTRFERQIARIERLVGDFLDLTRLEAGKLDIEVAPADLREVTRETAELFTSWPERIDLIVPDTPVVVRCDRARIGQVLSNLLSNAFKYSQADKRVTVTVALRGTEAEIAVADQGLGIAADEMACVFEPFFRGRAAKHMAPGIGLGLYASRRIVEMHGGRLEIESAEGRGTTVRVQLPAGEPQG